MEDFNMTIQQTMSELHTLKLTGMKNCYEEQLLNSSIQSLSFDERFSRVVEAETHHRKQSRQQRLLRGARLKMSSACVEDIKFIEGRFPDKQQLYALYSCEWVKQQRHVILTGSTGGGKTWLACALAQMAIRKEHTVAYRRTPRLLEEFEIGHSDGSLAKLRISLSKPDILVLDDWGLARLNQQSQHDLLEMVDDRTGNGSLIITSQLPVTEWHKYLGGDSLADAILDRILHRAYVIKIEGESMRKLNASSKEEI
jgi:DNA replication protein DnaC